MSDRLTHVDETGAARMVDVGGKTVTRRRAVARGAVRMSPEALELVREGSKKGDVLQVARIAGIQGAKRTADLIPLCHPLPLDAVQVDLRIDAPSSSVIIEATASTSGRTGVEMEAMTAVSAAALTVYDMVKAVDRGMVIGQILLLEKEGGRSGHWIRENSP
ncbi:MAG: cyclic pyranopterin monophosphate synthase MoaC [Deltaproteobacteria bacterium]|nr:cyclic pyranopterin monophosphate synthase MoaC [Deltaproteobacteria bacterium]